MKKDIEEIMKQLKAISDNFGYSTFELALVLFLRADIYMLEDLTIKQLNLIAEEIEDTSSLMSDDLKESVDDILYSEDN